MSSQGGGYTPDHVAAKEAHGQLVSPLTDWEARRWQAGSLPTNAQQCVARPDRKLGCGQSLRIFRSAARRGTQASYRPQSLANLPNFTRIGKKLGKKSRKSYRRCR